jgi:NADH-quinone oxidoreductase subunit J
MEEVLFWIFASLTVGSAGMVIFGKSAISSAMALVASFFFLAGIYVLLLAHTIAVLQILVYAGAIMVLFLFVIMLLSITDVAEREPLGLFRVLGGAAALVLFWALVVAIRKLPTHAAVPGPEFGTLKTLGQALYTQYLFPFEAVSILLLAAIVGAVVVAKPRI